MPKQLPDPIDAGLVRHALAEVPPARLPAAIDVLILDPATSSSRR